MAMLFSRRKRLAELAEREAAGETFWTTTFEATLRARIWYAWSDLYDDRVHYASQFARAAILRDEGMTSLMSQRSNPSVDFAAYVQHAEDEMMPTVVEAMALTTRESNISTAPVWAGAEAFQSEVNLLLREHRVSYELTSGEMIPFESLEMHTDVVMPALRLLARSDRLEKAETAYRDALAEISSNNAGDAITDAGTALQETLSAFGCDGNALGPLIRSARAKGLLGPHDTAMVDAIEKVMQWVSADRSQRGDAHQTTDASIDDAWLIVHVVGALIVRLSRREATPDGSE